MLARLMVIGVGAALAGEASAASPDAPVFRPDWNQATLYTGWRATDLLGLPAVGDNGDVVGRVGDLLIGFTGTLDTLVVEESAAADGGRTRFGVPWDSVDVADDGGAVAVPVIRENVGEFQLEEPIRPEFGAVEMAAPGAAEWSVATLLDTEVHMDGDLPMGEVDDLIFDRDGALEGVVVAAEDGSLYGIPWTAVVIEPDAQALSVPLTPAVVDTLEPFRFDRMAEGVLPDE